MKGYLNLTSYTVFFLLFVFLIMEQLDVPNTSKIDGMVRHNLLDQDGALSNVLDHGSVFDYLLKDFDSDTGSFDGDDGGGILGNLFQQEWYNGNPITSDERGFLFQYNLLIGGILIVQERGLQEPCEGMYHLFYPTCFTEKRVTADPPTTSNGTFILDDPEYLRQLEATKFGKRTQLEDPLERYAATILESFQYDPVYQGFSTFLSLAEGTDKNMRKVQDLRDMKWLDKDTRSVSIRFTFYNGNFGKFAYAKITMTLDQAGMYRLFDPESGAVTMKSNGGTQVDIGALNMEPYLTSADFTRLAFEVIFMVWVFWLTGSYVRELITAIVKMRFRKWFNHWAVLDGANYCCFIAFIILRANIIKKILDNPVVVPTNEYKTIFQEVDDMTRQQLTWNFFSILLCIFRFFKYYEFQPRLQIVNKTMGASMVHLYHFCVIFFVIYVGFAFAGHLNFGSSVRDFSTLGHSMQVMWESLFGNYDLGPSIGNGNLSYINPAMGVIFFISWIFLAPMVLMNVFIAILMDSYASAKDEGRENAVKAGKEEPDAVSDDIMQFITYSAKAFQSRHWKYSDTVLLHALQKLDQTKPDPAVDTKAFKQELLALQEKREALNTRISFLEAMTADDVGGEPFHLFWNRKFATFEELAQVVPFVNRKMKDEQVNVEEMAETWDETVRFVPDAEEEEGDASLVGRLPVDQQVEKLKAYLALLGKQNQEMKAKLGM